MGRRIKTHEEVKDRLLGTGVHWVGRYEKALVKTVFGCDTCQHQWEALPGSVFSGSRCPLCFTRKERGHGIYLGGRGRGYHPDNELLEDHGEWLVVNVAKPGMPEQGMKIDREDYDELVRRVIRRIFISNYGYPRCRCENRVCLVHRLLLPGVKEVDHINRDKLDNRRANLRSVEAWQQQANRGPRKNNTLGVAGVSWNAAKQMFCAQHRFCGKIVHQSYHKTLDEAATERRASVMRHCGEFAPAGL